MSPALLALRRVRGMVRRHLYLLASSWPRVLELAYWPTVQMITWGFVTKFLHGQTEILAQAFGVFISAVLLWDVLFRGQLSVSLLFMEEMYARHIGHLFTSPLRPHELVGSLFAMSVVRTLIGVGGAALLAIPIHQFSIFEALGWPLIVFFVNLLWFGWAIGLIIAALVLRLGLGAESLAWAVIFMIQPLSGVFYPLDVLPGWVQPLSWCLPSAAVFEGMRAVLLDGALRGDLLLHAVLANLAWMAGAVLIFLILFRQARARGLLLQVGE
ncbi:MAG TPA: ABC transporter permease [Geminicoccaceae bacterium]